MKIEIDLNDILGDEDGAETLQDSVRRQVISHISDVVKRDVKKRIDDETNKVIGEALRAAVAEQMPAMVADLLNAEYTPVSSYGSRGETTTLRAELLKIVTENMVYKKTNYSNDANTFTKAVDAVIGENVKQFQADFNAKVDDGFKRAALEHATKSILVKLGVPVQGN